MPHQSTHATLYSVPRLVVPLGIKTLQRTTYIHFHNNNNNNNDILKGVSDTFFIMYNLNMPQTMRTHTFFNRKITMHHVSDKKKNFSMNGIYMFWDNLQCSCSRKTQTTIETARV